MWLLAVLLLGRLLLTGTAEKCHRDRASDSLIYMGRHIGEFTRRYILTVTNSELTRQLLNIDRNGRLKNAIAIEPLI